MPPQEARMEDFTEEGDETETTARENASLALKDEAWQLINVVIPTVIIQLGSVIPWAYTASYVGRHLGSVYLDGFTLAILTGNLLTLALLWGLYSASDTLSPQAFGAGNYKEVGLIAMRGFIGSMLILLPINSVLFFNMEDLLIMFGEEPEPSRLAAEWYRIYIFTLPFYALYMVLWKFLSSQEIMTPIVIAMLFSVCIVLPVSLQLLVPTFGFIGSAVAILIFQMTETLLLLAYLIWRQPHYAGTWPGLSCWREAVAWEPFKTYMQLGAGGMLASGEWIWWEFISLIIGTLGIIPLSAHTIPTQVIVVAYMVPIGIGTGLSIRLGSILPRDVPRAKQLVVWCAAASIALFAVFAIVMYMARESIFAIFTTDIEVLEEVEEIWWKVCVYYFVLCIFGIITGVAVGLGMQWTLGFTNLVFLWFIALPGLYIHAIAYGGGLEAAWSWIYPPYIFMNVILAYWFFVSDWDAISLAIRKREHIVDKPDSNDGFTEQTPLLL